MIILKYCMRYCREDSPRRKLIWLDNKYYSCTSQPTIYLLVGGNGTRPGVMLTNQKEEREMTKRPNFSVDVCGFGGKKW